MVSGGATRKAGQDFERAASVDQAAADGADRAPVPLTESATDNHDLVIRRRRWSYALVRRAKAPIPAFGSKAWMNLTEGSAEKVASVVVAAEAWARDADDIEARLQREVAESRRAFERLDAELHRAAVAPLTRARVVSSFAERRARQLAAAAPRQGDYRGGAVEWTGDSA